jgi:predicted ATPase/class 3 adenylate cyclase
VAAPHLPREDLPEGTVTLLFTDIEGSTQLLRRLGPRYADVQARHRILLRAAFADAGGVEVDTQGDAFMVVFRSAADAAAAAVEAQRALADETWPDDVHVPVRMGLHTGEPERGPEGYVGIDVVRAARICAVAHGRQILVSQLTRDLLADAGYETIDLGRHGLKDIAEQERLYQLVAVGMQESFPPPRTLGGATLPALHHRLVGRQHDLAHIQGLLARPDVRLVTITGAGGAGKSRLALEAASAAALDRPVHLVGLAPVSDPSLVLTEIARTVGAREVLGRSTAETIADTLRDAHALLFLDNLEHLTPAAHDIAALLDLTADLDILTTSRVPLRLSAEHVLPLDPLPMDDAVTLFVELAAARGVVLRDDTRDAVRAICQRLDGLPLAIELVAARLVVLPPTRVLEALDQGLALEMEGPIDLPERQRTLRATIAWSYRLLTPSQQSLHDALSVFAGGCTLDDVRAVSPSGPASFSDLEALVAWSLVRSDISDGDARLSMLETVREDAVARLEQLGRLDDLRRRHADRFLELAAAAEDGLAGPDQAQWLERIERELDNVRATLDWCLSTGRVENALRALSALGRFWRAHGHVTEARRRLSLALEMARDVPAGFRADALWTAARQADAQSDWAAAESLLDEALVLYRADAREREVALTLSHLGSIAISRGDQVRGQALCEEALTVARGSGDARATSAALNILASVYMERGDQERALALHDEALELRRRLADPLLVVDSTYNLAIAAFLNGDFERAREAFEESLELAHSLGDILHGVGSRLMLAEMDLLSGDVDLVEAEARECLAVYTRLENDRDSAECLVVLGGAAVARHAFEEGAHLLGAADALRGDAPVNVIETPVLERFEPKLIAALGEERYTALRAAAAQASGPRRTVVAAGTRATRKGGQEDETRR